MCRIEGGVGPEGRAFGLQQIPAGAIVFRDQETSQRTGGEQQIAEAPVRGDRRHRVGHGDPGDVPARAAIRRHADDPLVAADQQSLRLGVDERGLQIAGERRGQRRPALAAIGGMQDAAARSRRDPGAARRVIARRPEIRVVAVERRRPAAPGILGTQHHAARADRDQNAAVVIRRHACQIDLTRCVGVRPARAVFGAQDGGIAAPEQQGLAVRKQQATAQVRIDHLRVVRRCGWQPRGGQAKREQCDAGARHARPTGESLFMGLARRIPSRQPGRECQEASGSAIEKVVPTPGSEMQRICPPCASTIPLAMYSPRPVPVFWCFLLAE